MMIANPNESYDINNLPEIFSLPDDIEDGNVDFTSIETMSTKLSQTLQEKIDAVKFDISKKFANKVKIQFEEIVTPTTQEAQSTQQTSTKVIVNGEEQSISYKTIMKTAHNDNGELFGQSKDYQDKPITFDDNSPYICNGTNDGVGSGLDYTSFINKNDKLYMVSQFECQVGSMYMAELEQDPNGTLTPKNGTLKYISQKGEFGGFVHCAGQTTPWQSMLGSEEYEPNARSVADDANATTGLTGNKYYDEMAKFWGNDIKKASPYYYGWTPEVQIGANGDANYAKHYSMGRFSHELAYVMPDKKTVYLSDDGTNVGLFMFVADSEEDLSAGILYAAKWNQTSSEGAGSANLSWISLGHATSTEIREYLDPDKNISTNDAKVFSDIFETADINTDNSCPSGFSSINTSAYQECLKVKDGMEKAASRLETRRYAAIMGATTEFRKEEGITFDKNSGTLYVAMSAVAYGMEDNKKNDAANTKYDVGSNNDIKLPYNPCGAIYALDVNSSYPEIDSKYVVGNMYSILEGTPATYDATSIYAGNTCDVNGISNPDNVAFLDGSDILTIGEDTGAHKNNVVWSYNTKSGELTRIFTTPLGAETTSPFWYNDLKNGFGYLSVVTQHPDAGDKESAVGYVGPFKNLNDLKESNTINSIKRIATYGTGVEAGSEIVSFDKETNKIFSTNGATNKIDVTQLNSDGTLGDTTSIDISGYGPKLQSVAVKNSIVAVAVGSDDKTTTKGKVVLFDTNGNLLSETTVGL